MFSRISISRMFSIVFVVMFLITGSLPIQTAVAATSKTADHQTSNPTGDTPAVAKAREASKVTVVNNNSIRSGPVIAASGGGIFTVNTANDSNTVGDSELSLREAIQIANATLLGPFSVAERGQLSGCTFSAGGNITNNCGGGHNLIKFEPTLTQVIINGRLPETTADDLTITGQVNSGRLIVNSTAYDLVFWVGSDNVDISQMAIINANGPIDVVSNVPLKGLRIHDNYLGITPDMTSCTDVRLVRYPDFDVILFDGSGSSTAGDGSAYIYGNTMGCALYDGVAISNLSYVYIGEDALGNPSGNYIGRDQQGHAFPNGSLTAGGISSCCGGIPQHNVIANNTIANSYFYGIDLVKSPNNTLTGNILENNGTVGIYIEDSANLTLTNNIAHDNGSSGLWLSGALTTNNSVSGGQYYRNGAAGITEGEGANTNSWLNISTYANAGLGVDKNNNGLPDATGGISITSIGQSAGVVTVNGQFSGMVFLATIYHIELYRLAPDASGYGEGRTYLGAYDLQLTIPNDPTWHIIDPSGQADCYTAILTVKNPFISVNDNTSYEFAANYGSCIPAPIVNTITRANPNPTNAASVQFTVTFSESVTGVGASDFELTTTGVSGATVSGVTGSGSVYTVTVNTGTGSGTIRLDVPASETITNLVGTPLAGLPYTSGQTYTITRTLTSTSTPTSTMTQTPTLTPTPTRTVTPTVTQTPTATMTPMIVPTYRIYLPLVVR